VHDRRKRQAFAATPAEPGDLPWELVVNDAALVYMRERAVAAHVIARLSEHPDRYFADQAA